MKTVQVLAPSPCRVFFTLTLLLFHPLSAECRKWWTFEERSYYEPLIAGVREPHVSALALAGANRMAFMVNDEDPRQVWDIDLGAELPVAGWESRPSKGGRATANATGWGIWIPIDFHMIEDFVDDSSPIINTDYRFGIMAKVQRGLSRDRWLSGRVFIGHESTHLGDEFAIAGQRRFPRTFERINVSWEYLDVGVMYEHQVEEYFGSLRGGVTTTLPFRDTYYSTDPESVTRSPLGPVTASKNWFDPYLGLELERDGLFGDSPGWALYISGEVRFRTVYDYHKASSDAAEERQASLNLITGLRKSGTGGALSRVSPFLRLYRGVNPHGQFRNQKDYKEFGLGLRLVR